MRCGVLGSHRFGHSSLERQRQRLPVFKYRDAILYLVENHATTIIVGETGSGKTTQIPQVLIWTLKKNQYYTFLDLAFTSDNATEREKKRKGKRNQIANVPSNLIFDSLFFVLLWFVISFSLLLEVTQRKESIFMSSNPFEIKILKSNL